MRPPQGAEWLFLLLIVLLLFGAKRLPDMARGLGRSLRILKAETRGMADDDELATTEHRGERAVEAVPSRTDPVADVRDSHPDPAATPAPGRTPSEQ